MQYSEPNGNTRPNRKMPADIEAERQVLGALLLRSDLLMPVGALISTGDFHWPGHRLIYDAISEIFNQGGEVEAIRVIQYLRDRELLEKAGGDTYVLRLVEGVLAPAGAQTHARRVRNQALRRSLIEAAQAIQEDASKAYDDENQFLKKVEDRILGITNKSFSHGVMHVGELKEEFSDHVKMLLESRGRNTGLETHFTEFDRLTAGLKGGELIILAARPGMGKTTFAMNIASNVAMQGGKNVLVYSLEMSKLELLLRVVCSTAQFNHGDLKRGNIPPGRAQDVLGAIDQVFASPMYIDDSGTLDVWDLVLRSRKLALELDNKGESLGLVIVDYLQLLSDPDARKMGRQHEVATISRTLKQLSKMINVPVIALSQMNRSVEQRRGDSRPQLSDLRESGAIEQDADIVMFIHREMHFEEDSPEALENRGLAEVIIAKHRNGPVDDFKLAFRPEINRFDNVQLQEPTYA